MSTEIKRNSASPYHLPWEGETPFHLTLKHIKSHYSEKWKLDTEDNYWASCKVIALHKIELKLVGKGKTHFIQLDISKSGLQVSCGCNKQVQKLCVHAAKALINEAGRRHKYFERFYFEELDLLPPEQKHFFQFKTNYSGAEYDAHPQYGRVYKYNNEDESKQLYPASTSETGQPILYGGNKLRFVIPFSLTIGRVPFFLPFLSNDYKGKRFGKSYLIDPTLPQPDREHSYLSQALENISRKMLALNSPSNDQNTLDIDQKMIALWRQTLLLPIDRSTFIFGSVGWKLKSAKYPPGWVRENQDIKLTNNKLSLNFKLSIHELYTTVTLQVIYQDRVLENLSFLTEEHSFFVQFEENEMVFIDNVATATYLQHFRICGFKYTILKQDEMEFLEESLHTMANSFRFTIENAARSSRIIEKPTPHCGKIIRLSMVEDFLYIEPKIRYETDVELELSNEANIFLTEIDGRYAYFYRDKSAENQFIEFLDKEFQSFETAEKLTGYKRILHLSYIRKTNWLNEFLQQCKQNDISLQLIDLEQGSDFYPFQLDWEFGDVQEAQENYHLNLSAAFGQHSFSLEKLKDVIFKRRNIILLEGKQFGWIGNGERDILRPILARSSVRNQQLVVPQRHILALHRVMGEIKSEVLQQKIKEKRNKLIQLDSVPLVPVPETVKATLRPYQIAGFSWMVFLKEFNWGGILADEMGLGKTLQVIALLEHHFLRAPGSDAALVVVPTSLLFNWANEIDKFAPTRAYSIHHGTNRPTKLEINPNSLLITTYGTLLADLELFSQYTFSYLIMDESQSIKNRLSKRYKAVDSIQADHTIALSGTPIENGIEDLYTQINLVNPDFFGSFLEFKRTYQGITDGTASVATMEDLQNTIDPFLLKRTKKQVASELPDKTETLLTMDMLPEQRKIYDQYRMYYKNQLENKMISEKRESLTFFAMEGLMKLRQICNSPCLLKDKNHPTSSVKIEELLDSLRGIVNEHKVLVFSFFTGMLQKVKEALEEENITYTYLDGQLNQRARQEAVEQFQSNRNIKVFLISLRAGGTGLNLTAADYVYILDPWWNPAVESQAIDRSHRIGQNRPVMVYRTICRNSVEEGILALQNKKLKLAKGLIQEETNLLRSLDKDDLLKLFS